ncbi:hypothetical protein ACT2FY_44835 [Paraburkholderia fungorum]|uniref:hypothetical protein n=1 Tax=Paraburkholderia fungorum TaxID=134537 RepID=UPI00402B6F6B
MTGPRRPRSRRDADIGVFINRSSNFSVGAARPDDDEKPNPPPKTTEYVLRTFTGRVLEGVMLVPGRIHGDLIWGVALVQRDGESSLFTVTRSGNTVTFDADDFEAVNGAHASVSYLTAK